MKDQEKLDNLLKALRTYHNHFNYKFKHLFEIDTIDFSVRHIINDINESEYGSHMAEFDFNNYQPLSDFDAKLKESLNWISLKNENLYYRQISGTLISFIALHIVTNDHNSLNSYIEKNHVEVYKEIIKTKHLIKFPFLFSVTSPKAYNFITDFIESNEINIDRAKAWRIHFLLYLAYLGYFKVELTVPIRISIAQDIWNENFSVDTVKARGVTTVKDFKIFGTIKDQSMIKTIVDYKNLL